MSLILTWDEPTTLDAEVYRLRVLRNTVLVAGGDDVPWGAFEDTESNDTTATYVVELTDRTGQRVSAVEDVDIRRFVRGPTVSAIHIALISPDGGPMARAPVHVRSPTGPYRAWLRTNSVGDLVHYAAVGARLIYELPGRHYALDVVIPAQAELTMGELQAYGSWVPAEKRGWY